MAAAAHADVLLDDAKLRDARWHRATAGDVLLREATNMRPTGTNRDGRTMVLARELWWRCGGWAQWAAAHQSRCAARRVRVWRRVSKWAVAVRMRVVEAGTTYVRHRCT